MSHDPNDDQGGSGQSGGNQPQGGQPQGGQPQGGHPQGGHPQGQPAGGQPPRQYNTGPGIGDIFNRPDTKNEMKIGAVLYALVAVGLGIAGIGATIFSGGTGGVGGGGLGFMSGGIAVFLALLLGPVIALIVGLRQADELAEQPQNLLYANAATTAFIGTLVVYVIGIIVFLINGGGQLIGPMISNSIGPVIVAGIGSGVTAAGTAWAVSSIEPGPSQPQPQAGGQAPQR